MADVRAINASPAARLSGADQRFDVLGVAISAVDMDSAIATIEDWIRRRDQHYVCLCTVHGVMECQRDPALRDIVNRSGMTTPDGMPLVWLGRLFGFPGVRRVYGPDLLLAMCARSVEARYRHFFLGGEDGVAQDLVASLQAQFPGLQVAGTLAPRVGSGATDDDDDTVRAINSARADIVWVSLGTPKQDRWMATHVGRVDAPVLIGVGAAFDFHSGRKQQAPVWMQRSGLEWLFRLSQEPGRLWYRYLVYNPLFLCLLALQLLGIRKSGGRFHD